MEADAESKTVVVTGQSLNQDEEDMCHLYFENERRSGGGEIEEQGIIWNEEQRCFFITFVDGQVARRVASREHSLKNCPLQVQLWSRARFLISGVPAATTFDCFLNYIENVLDIDVASAQLNRIDNTALIVFESPPRNMDIQGMEQACQNSPLEEGVSLSFHGVLASITSAPADCSTILVTGLKPDTATDAIRYFFSNKRRNAGGPIKVIERDPGSSAALVHFEDPADAESVVRKGSHVLDGQSLCVSLQQASLFRGRPDMVGIQAPDSWGPYMADMQMPDFWEPHSASETVKLVALKNSDQEYQTVANRFLNSDRREKVSVKSIHRVQNPHLYLQYAAIKSHLEKQNPGIENEKVLWHGTSADAITSINHHGFNRSYCDKNATPYGQGVYFAVSSDFAAKSHLAVLDPSGNRHVYLCKVLVGHPARGSHDRRILPVRKEPVLYDSATDSLEDPHVYVIFRDAQAYPEYLITFQ